MVRPGMLMIGALLMLNGCATFDKSPIKAAALRPGDTVGFVAPASPLGRERMELARRRLEEMGLKVRVPADLYRQRGYLAGTDQQRADELMAMFRDPEIKAILPGTGGYGTTRMLDLLDYNVIRANPKVFLGFSDITGLHLAIQRRTGLITFHSPNPMWGLGSENNLHPLAAKYFWRALLAEEYEKDDDGTPGYVIELPSGASGHADDAAENAAGESIAAVPAVEIMVPGKARGRLTGGNLSLVTALMGTPYEMETDGRVLFLEDVGERPYRIDRYLSQLRLAGKFDHAAAIVLGHFRDCEPKPDEQSLSLHQVFEDYFADMDVPVILNFPAGHVRYNGTLPIGALVEIDTEAGVLRVLEDPAIVD